MNLKEFKNKRGIEKETLRVLQDGNISTNKHPLLLGSKFFHKNITTDFSEGLLEFITKPLKSIKKILINLKNISSFCAKNISENEYFFCYSMPPYIDSINKIKIAKFGDFNDAQIKEIYRKGLAERYGKKMQIIAGLHYNFSFSTELINILSKKRQIDKNGLYFSVINNYFSFMWLIPYLFGSSPICAKTSVINKPNYLQSFENNYYIGEYATSLRLSEIGYNNKKQNLFISFKNIKDYIHDLKLAINTPNLDFKKLGIYDKFNYRQQMNCNLLQNENEYYFNIRPKAEINNKEYLSNSVLKNGVEYLEIRILDINPFTPIGIESSTCHFMEALLMTCMLLPHKTYDVKDIIRNNKNLELIITNGRQPNIKLLNDNNNLVNIKDFGYQQLNIILKFAKNMHNQYYEAVLKQFEKFDNVHKTPSAQIISNINTHSKFLDSIMKLSIVNTNFLKNNVINKKIYNQLIKETQISLIKEKQMYKNIKNENNIDDYINSYYHALNKN